MNSHQTNTILRAVSKSTTASPDTSAVQQAQYLNVPAICYYAAGSSAIDLNAITYTNYSMVTVYNNGGSSITVSATGGSLSGSGTVVSSAIVTYARTSAVNWVRFS